jgi:hypothetical protein
LEFSFAGEPDAALRAARGELDYVDRILDDDSKNYHVSLPSSHANINNCGDCSSRQQHD